jgi:mono/diheme cytochrome c family protein
MRVFHRIAYLLLAVSGVIFPMTVAAQEAPGSRSRPGVPQTDQQRSGEALFIQNCTLCHVFSAQKKTIGIQASTELVGLFKKSTINDANVREMILTGIPKKMPSFRYNFEPREIDDLVAYLKIR